MIIMELLFKLALGFIVFQVYFINLTSANLVCSLNRSVQGNCLNTHKLKTWPE